MVPENPYGEQYADEHDSLHAHWATYDMGLEGCRMNKLHELIVTSPFDAETADKIIQDLTEFAYSKGYGDEDSFLVGQANAKEENASYHAAVAEQHAEDPDRQYSEELRISVELLSQALKEHSGNAPDDIVSRMRDAMVNARGEGQKARHAMDAQTPAEAAPTVVKAKPASLAP